MTGIVVIDLKGCMTDLSVQAVQGKLGKSSEEITSQDCYRNVSL